MLFDISEIDTSKVIVDREGIQKVNPHRFEFQQLDGIYYIDYDKFEIAGLRDVKENEFWVRGHIPGRPLFPGVLMIETAAQLVSYYAMTALPGKGFLGFASVDDVKFRGTVKPGQKIVMIGKMAKMQARQCVGDTQGFVNGEMVFEGRITGMWL
jgi:3-hydroxyacyl-[acyl-carrier-protein] dehydratase